MSANAPTDPTHTQAGSKKKKNNKKKGNASKTNTVTNGAVPKTPLEPEVGVEKDVVEIEENAEDDGTDGLDTPKEEHFSVDRKDSHTNGHVKAASGASQEPPAPTTNEPGAPLVKPELDVSEASAAIVDIDTSDASSRLEAMSQDREALRAEVEQLRKQLEGIQVKHEEELATIRSELEESDSAKELAESQYSNLLGKINSIKATLGERMKADKAALEEANERNEELESQNENLKESTEAMQRELRRLEEEASESSRELSSLRNRNNLSQQNWSSEREDLVEQNGHLRQEAEAAKEAMGEWEVLAMEERSIRENLAETVAELEDQLSSHKESYERAASERDGQSQAVDGLQRALGEIQEARKTELREMVERTESQLGALKQLVQQAEARATEAEAAKEALDSELERAAPFEKEVKEKNLLIGKLRHEAIVLNDHLTKALRFLKKAKPEDNIDRQIVTNHFLHFLALDRSDPKKFQVLQIIAALLNWTDEQKEQAGLARKGTSSGSLRIPLSPFHRTPSTPSLNSEFFPETPSGQGKETLAELWQGFLAAEAEAGVGHSIPGSRSASYSDMSPPPGKG